MEEEEFDFEQNRQDLEDLDEIILEECGEIEYDDDIIENQIDSSFEESNAVEEARKKKVKPNEQEQTKNYAIYQINDLIITEADIRSFEIPNWLTNTTILAFMKSFDEKNILLLDYNKTNILTNFEQLKEKNALQFEIFPKVC